MMSDKEALRSFNSLHSFQIRKNLEKKSKEEPAHMNEDILDIIGHDGLWQRGIFLWILFATMTVVWHSMAMSFYAPNLEYWCSRPEGSNKTVEEWKNVDLPEDKHCSRFRNQSTLYFMDESSKISSTSEVVACDSWEYDTSFYLSTVLSQFDLVCERDWLVSLSTSIFNLGTMLSNVIVSHLSDRFGRRPLLAASIAITLSAAVVCAFSTSFVMFAVTRFFVAFGLSGLYTVSYVLLMEIVGPKQRSFYGVAVHLGWCVGFVCFPGVVWLLRDWFWIQMAITSPLVILLLTCWFIAESPRWLMSQGKIKEAERIVTKATKINGNYLSNIDARLKMMMQTRKVDESKTESGTIFDLFRTPGLWQMTLVIYFIWFSGIFVYYGLSYNTNELAGDPFVNFALAGAVEFPAYFLTMIAIYSHGRKVPMIITTAIGGLACLLTYPLPADSWITTALLLVGKFCITASVAIAFVLTAEIFPTPVRLIGLGSAALFSKFGSVLAPFARELGHATNPVVPHVLFGFLALMSGVLVLLLPETRGVTVPETLLEAGSRRKSIRKKKEAYKEFEMKRLLNMNRGKDISQKEGPEVIFQSRELQRRDKLVDSTKHSNQSDVPSENQQVSTVEIR